MDVKIAPFKVKAGTDKGLDEGSFSGYASVFGNVDSYGDIVEPGAFTRTLNDWAGKGSTIPVLWGHDMEDPFSNIGAVTNISQDDKGLHIDGQLDMDNPKAAQVYRLMKGGRTDSMSFAYSVKDAQFDDKTGVNYLKDLDLYEVSVVQVPANDQAAIEEVKMAANRLVNGVKSGRVLAQKHIDSLHTAYDALGSVIAAAESDDSSADDSSKSADIPDDSKGKGMSTDDDSDKAASVEALSILSEIINRKRIS